MNRIRGFTLMEVMIVVAIIIIIAAAFTATMSSSQQKAMEAKAKAEMAEMATACKMYFKDTGAWPYWIEHLYQEPAIYGGNRGCNQYGHVNQYYLPDKWKGPYLQVFEKPRSPWEGFYYIWRDTGSNPYKLYIRTYNDQKGIYEKHFVHTFQETD